MIDAATVERILCWRQAGLTLASISSREGVSVSAIKQIIKRTGGVSRGGCRKAVLEKAKQIVIRDSNLAETIALGVSASIASDLSLANQIRDNASLMLEVIFNDSSTSTATKARSLAALATAASVAQAISFRALEIDKQRNAISDDLPELTITGYSSEETEDIRRRASMSDIDLAALEEGEL